MNEIRYWFIIVACFAASLPSARGDDLTFWGRRLILASNVISSVESTNLMARSELEGHVASCTGLNERVEAKLLLSMHLSDSTSVDDLVQAHALSMAVIAVATQTWQRAIGSLAISVSHGTLRQFDEQISTATAALGSFSTNELAAVSDPLWLCLKSGSPSYHDALRMSAANGYCGKGDYASARAVTALIEDAAVRSDMLEHISLLDD